MFTEKHTAEKKAVCIIAREPSTAWLEFLSTFTDYDVYLVSDNNDQDYSETYKLLYPSVHIIQMDASECEAKGFINILHILFLKKVTGWEKALFYFAHVNKNYKYIWFFEDDVFFYSEATIISIDKKFGESDLLATPYQHSLKTSQKWHWWPHIKIEMEPPYYNAMVCGLRVSENLLSAIDAYAEKHDTLFFLEALFPTIAIKNNMRYDHPKQMLQIYYTHLWKHYSVNQKNIFHPAKDLVFHQTARRILKKQKVLNKLTFHLTNSVSRLYYMGKEKTKLLLKR